jgi:hypothetical protein
MSIYRQNSPDFWEGTESDLPVKLEFGDRFMATDTGNIYIAGKDGVPVLTRGYKSYVALISQVGVADPTVVVLDNSVGVITWARTGVGVYTGTSAGLFTALKTSKEIQGEAIVRTDANIITITASADGILTEHLVEIRVYN